MIMFCSRKIIIIIIGADKNFSINLSIIYHHLRCTNIIAVIMMNKQFGEKIQNSNYYDLCFEVK